MLKVVDKLKKMPREIWDLCFAVFIHRAGHMVLIYIMLYMTDFLHVNAIQASYVFIAFGIPLVVMAPISGWLADRFGYIEMVLLSLFSSSLVYLLFLCVESFAAILGLAFLLGLCVVPFRPATYTAVANFLNPEEKKSGIALVRFFTNLGMSLGPLIGALLIKISYSYIFIFDGLSSMLAGLYLLFRFKDYFKDKRQQQKKVMPKLGVSLSVLKDPRLIVMVVVGILISGIFRQSETTLPLYIVQHLGFTEVIYGSLISISTLIIIFLEVPINIYTEHWSSRFTFSFSVLLLGLGFGATYFANTYFLLALTVVIWTLGEIMFFPAIAQYASNIAPKDQQGTYMGYYSLALNVPFMLAAWAGTNIGAWVGYQNLWGVCFLASLLIAVLSWFIVTDKKQIC